MYSLTVESIASAHLVVTRDMIFLAAPLKDIFAML
jgi:hypothetical protein